MKVLIIATYELGHQPYSSLTLCTYLESNGHDTKLFDLSKSDSYDESLDGNLSWAQAILISVPMHTATSIALDLIKLIEAEYPRLPIGLFGLYATNLDRLDLAAQIGLLASGETQKDILDWLNGRDADAAALTLARTVAQRTKSLDETRPARLRRDKALSIENYTRLQRGESETLVGYVETSRGCNHKCLHCPVPVVYNGRIRINELRWVLDEINQLFDSGARHITFGDPDFLNAPIHAMKILRKMHQYHPDLTFDATIKVEHLIQHQALLPELRELGCLFIVSAFEHTSEEVLSILGKNHTRSDMEKAISLCREVGIEIRPSLLPFTPWTKPQDIKELFDFVINNNIVGNVDPIQFSIRLLVPHGSLLLQNDVTKDCFLSPLPNSPLSYEWVSPYSELEILQQELTKLAAASSCGESPVAIFDKSLQLVCNILGFEYVEPKYGLVNADVAKLSEAWFCCAEPTDAMFFSPTFGPLK